MRLFRMPEPSESPKKEIKQIQKEVGELVRRALIQVGDLQDVEERLKALAEKSSKMTPQPEAHEKPADPPV